MKEMFLVKPLRTPIVIPAAPFLLKEWGLTFCDTRLKKEGVRIACRK
jgi:hypothetical protein